MFVKLQKITKQIFQFFVKPIRPFFNSKTHIIRSGPARGLKKKGGFTFIPTAKNKEEIFLEKLRLQGKIVYDIGANIGEVSLFFLRAVGPSGMVISYEPNHDTIPILEENIKINNFNNVQIHNVAIGEKREISTLVVNKGMRGSGSMNKTIVSQFEKSGGNTYYQVEVFPLDDHIRKKKLPLPNFIKIDTEGFEYQCLLGMQRVIHKNHPDLYIEMHGATLGEKISNAKRIIYFLSSRGYSIYHVELEKPATRENFREAARGHLYCTYRNTQI